MVGVALGPVAAVSAAGFSNAQSFQVASTPKLNPYSATLVSRYTTECTTKVSTRGKTMEQAKKLCQCSMTQMQMQKTQSQAIGMLIAARFSSSIDPKTGLPTALSPYFAPCKA
jgi:hypothetical protein